MSYRPPALVSLGSYWVRQGGVNLGIVGNTAHVKGYHLGKDRIFDGSGPGIGWDDYSVKTTRDRAGLSDAASAIDLGRLDGSLSKLWTFSAWLARECMKNPAGTRDVREVIFWHPERNRVVGWSDLNPGVLINDYGDLSHKTHTHISYYRDSEGRDKTALFKKYFEPAAVVPPPAPEDDVKLSAYLPGYAADVKPTANVRSAPALKATILRVVATGGEDWLLTGRVKGEVDPDGGSDQWYVRWNGDHWEYTAFSNVPVSPKAPADASDLADATAAAEEAVADLAVATTKITNAQKALA
jgi:hypothetical protein